MLTRRAAWLLAAVLLMALAVPAGAQTTETADSAGVDDLSINQLIGIFGTCEIRDWRQLKDDSFTLPADYDPEAPDSQPIYVYTAQEGSGTRGTWDDFLGDVDSSACIPDDRKDGGPDDRVIFENNAQPIIDNGEQGNAIFFYSFGPYQTADPQGEGSTIGAVEGIEPSAETVGDGTFPFGRFLYNVYRATFPADNATDDARRYVGEDAGWICKGNAEHAEGVGEAIEQAITDAGFVPLPEQAIGGGVTGESKCQVTASPPGTGTEPPAPVADSAADLVLGSGSDTSYDLMRSLDRLYNGSQGCATEAAPGEDAVLDFACAAPPTVTTENADHDVAGSYFPLGSSNGINQLCGRGQANVINGSAPQPDYARSSRAPRSSDCGGLRFVAFARDAISWVSFPDAASGPGDGGSGLEPGVNRYEGPGRVETAAQISAQTFETSTVVYIATGGNFPDALAGGPPAAEDGSPILLTNVDSIPESTTAELERLQPDQIVVLGGPVAVAQTVATELEQYGTVTRLAGDSRITTATAISAANYEAGVDVVYVATGNAFPDALAGGTIAARADGPVLLVGADVAEAVQTELTRLNPTRIVILGGVTAVSQAVEDELQDFADQPITRLAGDNRFTTAGAIAAEFAAPTQAVFLATGGNFPDALAGVPAAARTNSPILLTETAALNPAAATALQRLQPQSIVILGGVQAVSETVEDSLAQYVRQ